MDNPLLATPGLPAFDRIEVAHVVPAIRELCRRQTSAVEAIEAAPGSEWPLFDRLADAAEPLSWAWGVVNHLMSVRNSPELRAAHAEVQGEVVATFLRLSQSRPIHDAAVRLRDGADWDRLSPTRQRIVTAWIHDARLSGVALDGEAKARFQAIAMELSELSTRFSNQVLDATKAWKRPLDAAAVAELPGSLRAALAANAGGTPATGPWTLTLDGPVIAPFLEHCRDRALREEAYRAQVQRASAGTLDNQPLIERILALRQEQARLLGFSDYAAQSLSSKMAPSVEVVEELLARLRTAARPHAQRELAELAALAGVPAAELRPWDVGFWAERLRERTFAFTDEDLRPYFALDRVLTGLFAVVERLFGVVIRDTTGSVPGWHPDVRHFTIRQGGDDIATFFLDPYSRPADKRGGAWMNSAVGRRRFADGRLRRPIAYLVCNQTAPADGKPSLMTFREVETLFHELGHGLQHMLTTVDDPGAAGIENVEWDAVELPSQFMENWCLHPATLRTMARHWQTGEPIPERLEKALHAAKTFRAGSMTLRQVAFAQLDLDLHHRYDPVRDGSAIAVQHRVLAAHASVAPIPEDRFLCAFGHLFAGGYAAGYYSYKWAEVLSADAFAAFEEAGLDDDDAVATTGRRFRDTVLALGGSRHPAEVFKAFRGRDPSPAALLRHAGLAG
ncbi:MAG: Oligopeptidase [Planctomycetota bacterium]|jgi:oligopeptidase A